MSYFIADWKPDWIKVEIIWKLLILALQNYDKCVYLSAGWQDLEEQPNTGHHQCPPGTQKLSLMPAGAWPLYAD